MRRYCLIALVGLLAVTPAAFAGDGDDQTDVKKPASLVLPTGAALAAEPSGAAEVVPPMVYRANRGVDGRRPIVFGLYGVAAVVQAYDGTTTMRVLRTGGFEANPMMQKMVANEKTLLATKIGATAATIIGVETLWRGNHRWAAVLVGIAANGAMAAVVNHNNKVLARLQAGAR